MARIRTIKPDFFQHADLYDAEIESGLPLRVAFSGLWCVADRDGRFKWRPREMKLSILPHDNVDFAAVLEAFERHGFIASYETEGDRYGFIPSWSKHQVINQREAKSTIPAPPPAMHMQTRARTETHVHIPNGVNLPVPLRETVIARDKKCLRCGAVEDLTVDHIFPQCIGGTHAIGNLRTLCRGCNSRRPIGGQPLIEDLARDGFTLDDMQRMCTHVHAHGEGKGREGKGSIPTTSGAEAPLIPDVAPDGDGDLKRVVFNQGLDYLAKAAGRKRDTLRPIVGKWVKDHGEAACIEVIGACQRAGAVDPISWIERALRARAGPDTGWKPRFPGDMPPG